MNFINLFYLMFYLMSLIMLLILLISSNLLKFHPLILSLMLMFYMMIMCLKLNYLQMEYWYSYILFLIMIGGVMILIMYFTSISSNEMLIYTFKSMIYLLMKYMFMIILMLILFFLLNKNYLNLLMDNYEILSLNNLYKENNFNNLKNLYMNMNMDLTIFFIIYLLLMMMFSAMICLKFNIPMRQMIL
uniref:NADH dehydrogenase subunit 6 n=1 Tax=Snellenius sp. SNS-2016 TaxID=1911514 RepID=A0A6F8AKU3_9HYME|nr:NADH dehydrogenase subunit 6 [Snellenius sp. SNS-2016]